MKGITPVIAIVLLLLITVALVGFAFGFFQKILGIATEKTTEQTESQTASFTSTIEIDNVNTGGVTVRNTGGTTISTSKLSVYVANAFMGCTWSSGTIAAGITATCSNASFCASGSEVKVTGPANKATATC